MHWQHVHREGVRTCSTIVWKTNIFSVQLVKVLRFCTSSYTRHCLRIKCKKWVDNTVSVLVYGDLTSSVRRRWPSPRREKKLKILWTWKPRASCDSPCATSFLTIRPGAVECVTVGCTSVGRGILAIFAALGPFRRSPNDNNRRRREWTWRCARGESRAYRHISLHVNDLDRHTAVFWSTRRQWLIVWSIIEPHAVARYEFWRAVVALS